MRNIMTEDSLKVEREIMQVLKMVHDPEIPVNIYDLGLIYEINYEEDEKKAIIKMTLTAPNCPMADQLLDDVYRHAKMVPGIEDVMINLVFDPPWNKEMMSDEAKLELGFL